jgi:outer membrane protein
MKSMKHVKKTALAIFLTVAHLTANAQGAIKKWSLDDCIQYAIEHSITAKQLQLQREGASIDLNTAKMSRLPDLNAGAAHNWNFGRSNNNLSGIYEDLVISNSNLWISTSMPLFTGFNINNQIKRQKLNLEAATQLLEKAKEDLALNIASLYLQVLFNKEILKVNEEQMSLSVSQVERTKVLVEVGKIPNSQLYDIEAQVARDEVSVVEAKGNIILSLLDLAQSLDLEDFQQFDIQDPDMESIMQASIDILPPEVVYENALDVKPAVKQKEFLLESSKRNLKVAQSYYFPRLSLGASYSNSYFYDYRTNFPQMSFSDQFSANGGELVGFSLSVPIFNRMQTRNQVRHARLNIENQQLELESTKKTLYKEIQTAHMNATVAREKYVAAERAVTASHEAFKYAQERYNVGNMSVFEFNDAKTKLIHSESLQIQAKYEYIFRTKILDFYNGNPIQL